MVEQQQQHVCTSVEVQTYVLQKKNSVQGNAIQSNLKLLN